MSTFLFFFFFPSIPTPLHPTCHPCLHPHLACHTKAATRNQWKGDHPLAGGEIRNAVSHSALLEVKPVRNNSRSAAEEVGNTDRGSRQRYSWTPSRSGEAGLASPRLKHQQRRFSFAWPLPSSLFLVHTSKTSFENGLHLLVTLVLTPVSLLGAIVSGSLQTQTDKKILVMITSSSKHSFTTILYEKLLFQLASCNSCMIPSEAEVCPCVSISMFTSTIHCWFSNTYFSLSQACTLIDK